MDIDYIFPWVNPDDKFWRLEFYKYRRPDDIRDCRFRDFGLLKYVLRGLAKNMPWLRKIHIILSQDSQIPVWLNTDTVNVIFHKDYIPKEFLPTYNSDTIESYLSNIKGLSEHFIYGNDDFYPLGPSSPEDWFTTNGKPKIRYYKSNETNTEFKKFCKRNFDEIAKFVGSKYEKDVYVRPHHYSTPLTLTAIKESYKLLEENINQGTTRFRNFNTNYNYYAFVSYLILKNQNEEVDDERVFGQYLEKTLNNTAVDIANFIKNNNTSIICINDTEKTDMLNLQVIVKAFQDKFPEKCKYEK